MISIDILKNIYHQKVDLLVNGLRIGKNFSASLNEFGIKEFNKGRKGGAGPAGGRYFLFENNSQVNVPLWGSKSDRSYLILEKAVREDTNSEKFIYCRIRNEKTSENYENIRLIPIPKEYNKTENIGGINNKKVALIHGTNCLASTIIQSCKYWRDGRQCSFCGIEISLRNGSTIARKSAEQLILAIKSAKKENLLGHITLTSGTPNTENKGAEYYIEVVSKIKKKYPDLPVHIQIEAFPVNKSSLLDGMKKAGVDTIGIHLEIPDD
ncbi:MAG: radical SAM protein, partial [Promethearchaeota archaeon]